MMNSEKVESWKIGSTIEVQRAVGMLLELIGVQKEQVRESRREQIVKLTLELRKSLFPKGFNKLLHQGARITFVLHGFLWYLPFELLPNSPEGGPGLIVSNPINYAGTMGLATRHIPLAIPKPRSIVLAAPKYLCDDETNQSRWIKELNEITKGIEQSIGQAGVKLQPSRWAKIQGDRIFILGRIGIGPNDILAPFGYDIESEDGWLNSWAKMPMRTPRELILPGLETGLVRGVLGDGKEISRLACSPRNRKSESAGESLANEWSKLYVAPSVLCEQSRTRHGCLGLATLSPIELGRAFRCFTRTKLDRSGEFLPSGLRSLGRLLAHR